MSEAEFLKLLGKRIREKRIELGFTQEELAARVNKSKSAISNLERGKLNNPTFKNIYSIAQALNVQVWELFKPKDLGTPEPNDSLKVFLKHLEKHNLTITEDELRLLENFKLKGKEPASTDIYILLWLIYRAISNNDAEKLLNN